jgi:hypothetical protein
VIDVKDQWERAVRRESKLVAEPWATSPQTSATEDLSDLAEARRLRTLTNGGKEVRAVAPGASSTRIRA